MLVMTVELLLAALVPLLIGVWLVSARNADALASEARMSVALLANVTGTQVEQLLVNSSRTLAQIASDDRVVEFFADAAPTEASRLDVEARLTQARRSGCDFALMMLLDRNAAVRATTDESAVGQSYPDRPYFIEAIAGNAFISDMILGRTTRLPGVFISLPIRDGDTIFGVAVLKIDGVRLDEIVATAIANGDGSQAMLVNGDGIILSHTNSALQFQSVGPLAPDRAATIDAINEFGVEEIAIAPLEPLASSIRRRASGAIEAELAGPDGPERWIVGLAPLDALPWSFALMVPERQFMVPLHALARDQRVIVILVAGLAVLYAVLRALGIVRPLTTLTSAADRVASGDLTARCKFDRADEIGTLGKAFDEMVPRLHEHLELRQSLDLAMDVQRALLPEVDPALEGLDVAGRSRYCDETGGDYYDFIETREIGPNRLMFALGDVMGHGIASALLMATARAALRSHMTRHTNLGDLMTAVNRLLSADARHGRFMTMVIAIADTSDGTIRWASAGHDPIIVIDPERDADSFADSDTSQDRQHRSIRELGGGDLPLGIDGTIRYREYRNRIESGDIILMGTDGIWETFGPDGTMYGKERMIATVIAAARRGGDARDMADAIEEDLASFREDVEIRDDITFVVARLLNSDDGPVESGSSSTRRTNGKEFL